MEVLYVVAVISVAVFGMLSESHRPFLLLAALISLPCGAISIFGLYALTGLFNWFANGFSSSYSESSSGGCDVAGHCWSRTTGSPVGARGFVFGATIVMLFAMGAVANVIVLRTIHRRRVGVRAATQRAHLR